MRRIAFALAGVLAFAASPSFAAGTPDLSLAGLLGVDRIAPREVTLALRDLARRLPTLSGPKARAANRMLARPTDGGADPENNGYPDTSSWAYFCGSIFCFHWVTTGDDAVPLFDSDANTVPDQVDLTQAVMDEVYAAEVTSLGYRPPKDDSSSVLPFAPGNPDGRFDIYLANIGDDDLYGYCSTDDPEANIDPPTRTDVSAYCVLDNDYAEFPDPLAALQVTAAHEFFHAVQYAYSWLSDSWFLESLAAWMEDEVYTDVNDNLQYLEGSPISIRGLPIDHGDPDYVYGSWIWWEYLSTTLGLTEAHALIQDIFARTEFPAGDGAFAHVAMTEAISTAGIEFGREMARFGVANATPAASYPEGAAYPTGGFAASATLRSDSPIFERRVLLDHLSSKAARVRPGAGMLAGAKVRIYVDLPRAASSPGAVVIVRFLDGSSVLRVPVFNSDGIGTVRVQFNRALVRDVLVGLGNASTRFDCFEGTSYSCEGIPRDDGMRTLVRATPIP